jgi:hypothetical protein
MRTIVIAVLLAAAPLSHAGCGGFSKLESPTIPSGARSTLAEMEQSRTEVMDYVRTGESYLDCSRAPDFYKNYVIDKLEEVAQRFNAEIESFSIAG